MAVWDAVNAASWASTRGLMFAQHREPFGLVARTGSDQVDVAVNP
ncbi:hypothetical protein [Stackebrandtia soli]